MLENLEETKKQAIFLAIAGLEKQFGKGVIAKEVIPDVQFLDSGSSSLNKALGGGWAKGRIVEIYGPESSGKTTLALHAIAEVQKKNGAAAFVDVEHAMDPIYATNLGVN